MAPAKWSVEEVVSIRHSLREALPTEVDFEAFCTDCYREVHSLYFSSGMQRMQKETLLLQHAPLCEIRERLDKWRIRLHADTYLPMEQGRLAIQQALACQLQELYERKEQNLLSGQDISVLNNQILAVRREQRHGPSLHHGEVLGERFTLDRVIGSGGFACVWRAYDRQNRNMAVVKVLHGQWSSDSSRIERFTRGARRMAELQHPAVVRVLIPVQQDSGFHFFATEYLAGGDLRRALLSRQISEKQALEALFDVADALQYAHERKFIHRDVKPSNILLDDTKRARIGDFDLVYVPDSTGGTRTTAIGSVFYAAPEAMENAKLVDCPTSDIYSLGMTLAFIIHGSDLPQQAWTDRKAFWRTLRCSNQLRTVVERATALPPKSRYQTATDFSNALRSAIDSNDFTRTEPTSDSKVRLNRGRIAGSAAAAVVIMALTAGWLTANRNPKSSGNSHPGGLKAPIASLLPVTNSDKRESGPTVNSIPTNRIADKSLPSMKNKKTTLHSPRARNEQTEKSEEEDVPIMELSN